MPSSQPPAGSISPSASPRLPSPPPMAEVQITPKSPTVAAGGILGLDPEEKPAPDRYASRRIRPGTKAADMASGPPLIPLAELDSPFQLQEHLKALYYHYTKFDNNTTIPISRETAHKLAIPPDGVDRSLWLYELCRFLVQKAGSLINGFFTDDPPCCAANCPEMRASEWQYLCAVHDPPKSCCAIDYCCHTLDWAANILTSQKHFPSRLTLGSEAGGGSQQGVKQLTNIFRRVYRMFAHAWFQHRNVFCSVEGEQGLYIFYKTVCDVYNLIPEDNYTVPAEAEGLSNVSDFQTRSETKSDSRLSNGFEPPKEQPAASTEPSASTSSSTGATTRRHKATPSVGSAVTPIAEGDEEPQDTKDAVTSLKPPAITEEDEESQKEACPPPAPSHTSAKPHTSDDTESHISEDTLTALPENVKDLDIGEPLDPSVTLASSSETKTEEGSSDESATEKKEEESAAT